MSKPLYPESEFRIHAGGVEIRTEEGKGTIVRGYAAVFGKPSEDLGGFVEYIDRGAFDSVLNDDVRALFNHDPNMLLGRTVSKTLRVWQDEQGLAYELTLPDTAPARDLRTLIERGDVNQSSFAFRVAKDGDKWVMQGDKTTRYIKRLSRLYDVSPVTYPAYPDTSVATRSMQAALRPALSSDIHRRRLDLLEREARHG
jgi:HK97 family phage prohead protease